MINKKTVQSNMQPSKVSENKSCKNESTFELEQVSSNRFFQDISVQPISSLVQPKLKVNIVGDKYEREADHIAEQVMRMPSTPAELECVSCKAINKNVLQTKGCAPCEKRISDMAGSSSDSIVSRVQNHTETCSGKSLPDSTQSFFESKFNADFSNVKVHTCDEAIQLSTELNAKAFTYKDNIFFNKGQYKPETSDGMRLLAHELTHVVQQTNSYINRNVLPPPELFEEKKDEPPALYSHPGCSDDFCRPFKTKKEAKDSLAWRKLYLLTGIAVAISPRVVPYWREYLEGGSAEKNLSSVFGSDFANTNVTDVAVEFLTDSIKRNLKFPPTIPQGETQVTQDITSLIQHDINQLGFPNGLHEMNFSRIRDIAGNLAGGVSKEQLLYPVGAKPSPFNDERLALVKIEVSKDANDNYKIQPIINFTVKDTIDLCPGNCGAPVEEFFATEIMSRYEASGISGDIPFTVKFTRRPAPFTMLSSQNSTFDFDFRVLEQLPSGRQFVVPPYSNVKVTCEAHYEGNMNSLPEDKRPPDTYWMSLNGSGKQVLFPVGEKHSYEWKFDHEGNSSLRIYNRYIAPRGNSNIYLVGKGKVEITKR